MSPILANTLLLALPTIALAALVDRAFVRLGLSRGNPGGMLVGSALWVVGSFAVAAEPMRWLLGILIGVVLPMSANRYDLTRTIREGRRWWKKTVTPPSA